MLSFAGGILGLGLTLAATRMLVSVGPSTLPRLREVQVDGPVVAYMALSSVVAALLFGSIAIGRSSFSFAALSETGRANTATRQRHRVRHLLLGAQVALALVLLIAAGLMVRSFENLRAVDPGFDSRSALTFKIGLPARQFATRDAAIAGHDALIEIDRRDIDQREPVAVVNESLAKRFFPDQDPIGRRLASNTPPGKNGAQNIEWMTIVGVVSNTPVRAINEPPVPIIYTPLSFGQGADVAARTIGPSVSTLSYVVRTSTPPLDLVPQIRHAVLAFDSNLPIAQVASLQELVDRASAQMNFTMVLLAIAAGVSLLLGTIGIYGVTSYIVTRRTAEIGVRLALGAEPSGIARQIVRQGAIVTTIGIAIGLAVAFAGGRVMTSVVYGINPRDPVIYATMAMTLLIVALLACWLPARRAARLNPVIALRSDA